MSFSHQKWEKSGQTLYNADTNQYMYSAGLGEQQTWDGLKWLPYLWKDASNELQYGHNVNNIEFASDKQILKAAGNVLCNSMKFFVQAKIGENWVNQPHGIPTRNVKDNYPSEGKCTGYLDFPDAHLSFGAQNLYDLQIGLEAGRSEKAVFGFRFKAPITGQVRFQVVLDDLEKLPNDWEWIWARFESFKNKEDRKIGVRVKDLEWRWTYNEAPQRDISVETNPDQTKKVTITFGTYDYTADEWLTIYPDQWGETGVTDTNDDCDENGGVDLDGYDADGGACGHAGGDAHDFSCRFQNVTIAGSPTSVDAGTQIEYDCGFVNGPTFNFVVYGLEGDTPDFNTTAPSTRTRTAASATFARPAQGNDKLVDGANFRAAVKEILDTSWSSGYDIGFTFDNGSSSGAAFFQIEEFSTGTAPRLTIVYTPAAGVSVSATTDALILTEYNPTVNKEINFTAGVDALVLTEYAADVNINIDVSAGVDALVMTEYNPTINKEISFTAGLDALILTEYNPDVLTGINVSAGLDELVLTKYNPVVNKEITFTAGLDELVLAEFNATVELAVVWSNITIQGLDAISGEVVYIIGKYKT